MCIKSYQNAVIMNDWNNRMMKIYFLALTGLVLASCTHVQKEQEWVYNKTIKLDGVNPIGITIAQDQIWLSDGDHNRLVHIDNSGTILESISELDRPMHIDSDQRKIYIPEYGTDMIATTTIGSWELFKKPWKDSLDAPASISVYKDEIAIADFYNNRIVYQDLTFGSEGKHEGEFYYPTDVQITDSLIWVADAYNNRIQVFDKEGKFVKMMGQDQKMNAATGLFVSKDEVFITDFENDRVLVFDHNGNLKQELKEGIAKATDLLIKDKVLHIINYRRGELVLYDLRQKEQS